MLLYLDLRCFIVFTVNVYSYMVLLANIVRKVKNKYNLNNIYDPTTTLFMHNKTHDAV